MLHGAGSHFQSLRQRSALGTRRSPLPLVRRRPGRFGSVVRTASTGSSGAGMGFTRRNLKERCGAIARLPTLNHRYPLSTQSASPRPRAGWVTVHAAAVSERPVSSKCLLTGSRCHLDERLPSRVNWRPLVTGTWCCRSLVSPGSLMSRSLRPFHRTGMAHALVPLRRSCKAFDLAPWTGCAQQSPIRREKRRIECLSQRDVHRVPPAHVLPQLPGSGQKHPVREPFAGHSERSSTAWVAAVRSRRPVRCWWRISLKTSTSTTCGAAQS